jgi:hypothetical protein
MSRAINLSPRRASNFHKTKIKTDNTLHATVTTINARIVRAIGHAKSATPIAHNTHAPNASAHEAHALPFIKR